MRSICRAGRRRVACSGAATAVLLLTWCGCLPGTWAKPAPARRKQGGAPPAAPRPGTSPPTVAPPIAPPPTVAPPAGPVLTLNQTVAIALNNNSTILLARERLVKAEEQIAQVDAQGRPQVRADLSDTYSGNATFGSGAAGTIQNPTLPGGGQIPVVVDQGGGSTSTFVGGGGGGTTAGTGTFSPIGGSSLTSPGTGGSTSGTGGGLTSPGTSTGTTPGFGTTPGLNTTGTTPGLGTTPGTTPGTGTGGTGTGTGGGTTPGAGNGLGNGGNGTPGTGTGGTNGGTGNGPSSFNSSGPAIWAMPMADLPPILNQYAVAQQPEPNQGLFSTGRQAAVRGEPHDTTPPGSSGGSGNGVITGRGGQHNNYSGRLNVTQYIDLFGLLPAAKDVARVTRDFYAIDLQRLANEVALSAKDTFFNVLRDQAQVSVQQEQVTAAQESVRIAQARFQAGAAARYDVLTAQTTLSNARQQLSAAVNQLNLARANLNNLLGIDQETPVQLQTPALPPLDQQINLQQSIRAAFAHRPELQQANNNMIIAQRLIKLAGATLEPAFGFVGSANYAGPATSGTPHDTYSISAQLGIPLSDGGATRSRVRQARSDLRTQAITRAQLQQNVSLEVRQAVYNISDAATRASSAGDGVAQAQEALRLSNVRYQNGLGTLLDVTNAEAQLAQARTNLLTAQFDYQTSLAQLIRAEGGR